MNPSRFFAVVATAFLAVACAGQTRQAATQPGQQAGAALQEAEDAELVVEPFDLTVADIEEDADLLNQAGEEVGSIESVLVDASGRPAAIAAEVGSFVGSSEKTVVIGLDRLQVNPEADLVTTLSAEELLQLPAWDG